MFAIVDGRAGTLGAADAVTEVGAAVDTAGGAEEIESTAVAPPRSHGFGGDGIIAVDEGIERKTRRLAVSGDPESRWLVKRHTRDCFPAFTASSGFASCKAVMAFGLPHSITRPLKITH